MARHPWAAMGDSPRIAAPEFNLNKFDTLVDAFGKGSPSDLSAIVKTIASSKIEAIDSLKGMLPEGAGSAVDSILGAINGKTSIQEVLTATMSSAAAGGCVALGAGAAAPLCAIGGKLVGGLIADTVGALFASAPQQSATAKALDTARSSIQSQLMATRKAILLEFSSKYAAGLGNVQEKVKKVLDDFYPSPMHSCSGKKSCSDQELGPLLGGFFLPFYAFDACPLIGDQYSKICGTNTTIQSLRWSSEYDGIRQGNTSYGLSSGWAEALLASVRDRLKARGLNLSTAINDTLSENEKLLRTQGRGLWWWPGASTAECLTVFFRDLCDLVWPAMQVELERRLNAVVTLSAIDASKKMLENTDQLATEILRRTKCSGDDCRREAQAEAAKFAQMLSYNTPSAVLGEIDKKYPDPNKKEIRAWVDVSGDSKSEEVKEISGKKTENVNPEKIPEPSPLKPILVVGGITLSAFAAHRLAKRYL